MNLSEQNNFHAFSHLSNVMEQIKKTYNFGLLYMPNNVFALEKVTKRHGIIFC